MICNRGGYGRSRSRMASDFLPDTSCKTEVVRINGTLTANDGEIAVK